MIWITVAMLLLACVITAFNTEMWLADRKRRREAERVEAQKAVLKPWAN